MRAKEFLGTLEEAGLQREKLLVANAYACMATEPKRDVEERRAVAACRPLLQHYVSQLPPKIPTLVLGKWAKLALTGVEEGLFSSRGFIDQQWDLSASATGNAKDKKKE